MKFAKGRTNAESSSSRCVSGRKMKSALLSHYTIVCELKYYDSLCNSPIADYTP